MFVRRSFFSPSHHLPAISLIAAFITFLLMVRSGISSQPVSSFPVLAAVPASEKDTLFHELDHLITSSTTTMRRKASITAILVMNGSADVLNTLCDALQKHRPALLLSFLNQRDNFYMRIVAASASIPLLTASSEYGPVTLSDHHQVRGKTLVIVTGWTRFLVVW